MILHADPRPQNDHICPFRLPCDLSRKALRIFSGFSRIVGGKDRLREFFLDDDPVFLRCKDLHESGSHPVCRSRGEAGCSRHVLCPRHHEDFSVCSLVGIRRPFRDPQKVFPIQHLHVFFLLRAALRHKTDVPDQELSAVFSSREQNLSELFHSESDRHIRADRVPHDFSRVGADAGGNVHGDRLHILIAVDPVNELFVCTFHISRKTDPEDRIQDHAAACVRLYHRLCKRMRRGSFFFCIRQFFRRHHRDPQPFHDI